MNSVSKKIDCQVKVSNKQGVFYTGHIDGFILLDNNVLLNLTWQNSAFDSVSATDRDFFECLIKIRIILLQRGFYVLCNGARKDVYPSGMQRDMGKAIKAYQMKLGQDVQSSDKVRIFEECSESLVTTPEEQKIFFQQWLLSNGVTPAN